MDASCKIQGSIHSFLLVHNMCPGLWVYIILGGAFFYLPSQLFYTDKPNVSSHPSIIFIH